MAGAAGILLLCGYAPQQPALFKDQVLVVGALTPTLQWLAVGPFDRRAGIWLAPGPPRGAAVIGGAAGTGHKVANALREAGGVEAPTSGLRRRPLARRASIAKPTPAGTSCPASRTPRPSVSTACARSTSPALGSQPRIVELLERRSRAPRPAVSSCPTSSASASSRAACRTWHGMPVVGLCETPFTGTNRLVKRISDVLRPSSWYCSRAAAAGAGAIGVKLSSPGPVIFKAAPQMGWTARRSSSASSAPCARWTTADVVRAGHQGTTRASPFGAFLRRTSLTSCRSSSTCRRAA